MLSGEGMLAPRKSNPDTSTYPIGGQICLGFGSDPLQSQDHCEKRSELHITAIVRFCGT